MAEGEGILMVSMPMGATWTRHGHGQEAGRRRILREEKRESVRPKKDPSGASWEEGHRLGEETRDEIVITRAWIWITNAAGVIK